MSTLAKLLMGASGAETVPDNPGAPYGGGYYAGKIMISGQAYALVVAPKTQGGEANLRRKTSYSSTSGTGSRNNGWANTQAMNNSSHPAAAFCRGLNINGYDDWYMPSRDELDVLYRAFKPTAQNNQTSPSSGANPNAIPPTGNYTSGNPRQTNVDVFKAGGVEDFKAEAYWSSTQEGAGWGWYQLFSNGAQVGVGTYTDALLVRAVRRVAIEE